MQLHVGYAEQFKNNTRVGCMFNNKQNTDTAISYKHKTSIRLMN